MHFLGSKFTQNALAAGAPPRTPLWELKRSPRPLADLRGRFAAGEREERGKREEEGRGKGNRGIGKGKREGGEGKRGGMERGRRREREGRGFASLALGGDRRPCVTVYTFDACLGCNIMHVSLKSAAGVVGGAYA